MDVNTDETVAVTVQLAKVIRSLSDDDRVSVTNGRVHLQELTALTARP
jgi:hypothetical protein